MKKLMIKFAISFLIISMIGVVIAPIVIHAATTSIMTKKVITNASNTTKVTDTSKKVDTSNTTKITNSSKIVTNTTTSNKTLNSIKETIKINTPELVKDTIADKEVIEKENAIEATLESYIHKNFAELKTVELGSKLIYTIYIKNTSNTIKAVTVKANMPEATKAGKIVANICKVEEVFEEGLLQKGLIKKSKVTYKGDITTYLNPNEEKAIQIEQDIATYVSDTLKNTFTVICGNQVIYLQDIKEISRNESTNTFISNYEEVLESEKFEIEKTPTKGTSEDILEEFGDVTFKGYKTDNATNQTTYGLADIGKNVIIKSHDMFTSKNMHCVNIDTGYWRFFKIENFYTLYNAEIYRYVNGELSKDNIPEEGIGIGNDYNLIDENYNQLAYMLSEIDTYNTPEFYQSIGIDIPYDNDRPDYSLSPVQIAIWGLQGVPNNTMIAKMRDRLTKIGITNTSKQNRIINNLLDVSAEIYANASAYDKYVENGKIGSIPKTTFDNYEPITVNGKTLVGPFTISYNVERATAKYKTVQGEEITKRGRYGEILRATISNNGQIYDKVCDENGNEINLAEITSNPVVCYFDVTGTNFDMSKGIRISRTMNNQYRQAWFYTLESIYERQNIIIGNGIKSEGTYSKTFRPLEKISLSGKVFKDIPQGIKPVLPPNGEIDDNEEGLADIEVYLIDTAKNTIVAQIKTNSNGEYEFTDVPKSEYVIMFAYDGMNNIVSEGIDSKATENFEVQGVNARTRFNSRFSGIMGYTNAARAYSFNGNAELVEVPGEYPLEYETTEQTNGMYISTLITEGTEGVLPQYKMFAKTNITLTETTENITLGLKERKGDLALTTDMSDVEVSGKSGKSENSYITYEVNLNNQESTIGIIGSISYYYDTKLELVSAEYKYYENGEYQTTDVRVDQLGETLIEGNRFNKINITLPAKMIGEGGRNKLFLRFKVVDNTDLKDTFMTYGEITSYIIQGGIVDKDSAPNNGITETGAIIREDDFGEAMTTTLRAFYLKQLLLLRRNLRNP